jgi:hypothetical protein
MPALNYAAKFAPLVEAGTKRQTIRALRKRPFRQGDVLVHYTNQRQPACRRMGYSIADEVHSIDIFAPLDEKSGVVILNDRESITRAETEQLAINDGFQSIEAFFGWFVVPAQILRHTQRCNLDFHFMGQLIKWPTSWTPAACPRCGATTANRDGAFLDCSTCRFCWQIGKEANHG